MSGGWDTFIIYYNSNIYYIRYYRLTSIYQFLIYELLSFVAHLHHLVTPIAPLLLKFLVEGYIINLDSCRFKCLRFD
jgi:hypothetical protein